MSNYTLLPTVRNGRTVLSPFNRNATFSTDVAIFESGAEQRCAMRNCLNTFVMTYDRISLADRHNLDVFFNAVKASYGKFSFALPKTQLLPNGTFAQGLKGWQFNGTGTFLSQTGSLPFIASPSGQDGTIFYAYNTPYALPQGATALCTLGSPTVSPYIAGTAITVAFWVGFFVGPSKPTGMVQTVRVFVQTLDTNGGIVSNISVATINFVPTGWQPYQVDVVLPVATGAVSYQLIFVPTYTNGFSGAAINVPSNCMGFGISLCQVYSNYAGFYPVCQLEDDAFPWTMDKGFQNVFSGGFKFRQTTTAGLPFVPALGPFPKFGPNGLLGTGYPFISTDNYMVSKEDLDSGPRSSYTFTGTPGFPSRPLKTWNLSLTTLNDYELGALESHFLAAGGQLNTFAFTDPEINLTYGRVRYASDTLTISHIMPGQSSVNVALLESYGPGWVA